MPHKKASDALSHITVIDLTRVRSGPTAVRQLADWGANVIKIEAPESIEPDGSLGAKRDTADFQNLHRNKRSLTLNLKEKEAIEIFYKLVKKSDVVVENFRPDVKDRLGINYEDLKKNNPRIILGSISGFGQDGPYEKRPGFDQIAQGMGGLMSITGAPGEGPMRVGIPVADLTAGLFCAMGIQTALIEREKSGLGQWVNTSLLQAQIFMLDFQAARWLCEKTVAGQAGNNHPTSVPTGVFKTSNGTMNLAVAGETIFRRFAEAIDKKEWIEMDEFKDAKSRLKNRDYLNELIDWYKSNSNELLQVFGKWNSCDQTCINFYRESQELEMTLLPVCYNLQDLSRKNLLYFHPQHWWSDDLHFLKNGWIYHFNAIPQNQMGRDANYWIKRTYEELYGD